MCTNDNTAPITPTPHNPLLPYFLNSFRPLNEPGNVQSMANAVPPHAMASPLDQYRLQLYNYAYADRLRYAQQNLMHPYAMNSYGAARHPDPNGFPFGIYGKLDPRLYRLQEEPKPQQSYIGLIAMGIISAPDEKMVLSDIYQYILDNYAYFRNRGPGWRNSIRHNLSLNDCFIKSGRSANGKGHYWAIHPANVEDFKKGDFRRRKAQRKVRKHMGLSCPDEDESPSPPPPMSPPSWAGRGMPEPKPAPKLQSTKETPRKRQFDMASILALDSSQPKALMCSPKLSSPASPTKYMKQEPDDLNNEIVDVIGTEDVDSTTSEVQLGPVGSPLSEAPEALASDPKFSSDERSMDQALINYQRLLTTQNGGRHLYWSLPFSWPPNRYNQVLTSHVASSRPHADSDESDDSKTDYVSSESKIEYVSNEGKVEYVSNEGKVEYMSNDSKVEYAPLEKS